MNLDLWSITNCVILNSFSRLVVVWLFKISCMLTYTDTNAPSMMAFTRIQGRIVAQFSNVSNSTHIDHGHYCGLNYV